MSDDSAASSPADPARGPRDVTRSAGLRRILHVDMDAFYASVEQRDDPSLRGRPVVVGGDARRRGVVAASSYEARRFGVRSAMPMARAQRLCPELVVLAPDFRKYKAVSAQVFEIFQSVTPLVEGLSLDEAYLDVTENAWNEPLGAEVARRIKARIREVTGLTASAGVAPNKFLAKIASGWRKPDGLTVIAPSRVEPFLRKLPVDALWGVGPVTAARLEGIGLKRLVDVRTADRALLERTVGSLAGWLVRLANGEDDRPVVPHREHKSVSAESTYAEDLTDLGEMRSQIRALATRAGAWLARHDLAARTVTLKVRYAGFDTVTRSQSRRPPFRTEGEIAEQAVELLGRTEAGARPVRLLGVGVHGLETPGPKEPEQLTIL